MIGNGLTAPTIQYQRLLDMATNNSYGLTLTSDSALQAAAANLPTCLRYIDECQSSISIGPCVDASIQCTRDVAVAYRNTSRNPLDLRQRCVSSASPSTPERECDPTPHVDAFLNSARVQSYLGVQQRVWAHCNNTIRSDFRYSGDLMKDRQRYLARLLDERPDFRVLIYAGDADLTFNWIGNDAWTKRLVWRHARAYTNAPDVPFMITRPARRHVGTVRAVGTKLAFLRVFQSGHLVAKDQPQAALVLHSRC